MEIVLYDSRSPASEPMGPEVPIIPARIATQSVAGGPASTMVIASPQLHSRSKALDYLGRGFLFFACVGILFAGLPAIIPKIQSEIRPKAKVEPVQTTFDQVLKQQKQQEEEENRKLATEEAAKYGVETDFSIVIPKISASAKVIPNVDPTKEVEYRNALKSGVAHAKGSSFPGGKGTIYLFAHSTNTLANVSVYNAVFYQLRDLGAGDKIIIFFTGQKFIYQVLNQQIVEAKDISWLIDPADSAGGEDLPAGGQGKLVLQTCWPPGTSLKRLIVIAKPV